MWYCPSEYVGYVENKLLSMAEAIGLTLGALGILEPAIKGCLEAYSIYQLTETFGQDFLEYTRRLNGQRARLKEWSQWTLYLPSVPLNDDSLVSTIHHELVAMRLEFQQCSRIMAKYSSQRKRPCLLE